jgi:hypothetical protein
MVVGVLFGSVSSTVSGDAIHGSVYDQGCTYAKKRTYEGFLPAVWVSTCMPGFQSASPARATWIGAEDACRRDDTRCSIQLEDQWEIKILVVQTTQNTGDEGA